MKYTLSTISALLALCLTGYAQQKKTFGDSTLPEFLKQYDSNHDGVLDEEERQAMKDAMLEKQAQWDTDGDGKLSPAEIEAMREALRAKVEERRTSHFAEVAGSDGKLSLEEFLSLEAFAGKDPTAATDLFNMMDTDDDGYVTEAEFTARLRPALPELPTFATADADHNNEVSLAEFIAATATINMPEETAREIFARQDKNKDGKLVAAEYPAPPPERPAAPPKVPPFQMVDVQPPFGKVSLQEFLQATRIPLPPPPGMPPPPPNPYGMPVDVATTLFRHLDKSPVGPPVGDGLLNGPAFQPVEYPMPAAPVTPPPQPPTFDTADGNHDGFVTEAEFVASWLAAGFTGETQLKAQFANLDKNHDGKLVPPEYPMPPSGT